MHTAFMALVQQHLHADADAEKRLAPGTHMFLQRFQHAGDGGKAAHAVAERADAGQDDVGGFRQFSGVGSDDDRAVRHLLEGLGGGAQIAGAVVDDGGICHGGDNRRYDDR
jgi:hypothetical protein